MTKFNETLLEAMTQLLRNRELDVVRITGYEEVEKSTGYCDTCYYEYTEVRIVYVDSEGTEKSYDYYGDFGELIRELTND